MLRSDSLSRNVLCPAEIKWLVEVSRSGAVCTEPSVCAGADGQVASICNETCRRWRDCRCVRVRPGRFGQGEKTLVHYFLGKVFIFLVCPVGHSQKNEISFTQRKVSRALKDLLRPRKNPLNYPNTGRRFRRKFQHYTFP